jgi:release factor glutamine methyltransferase
VPAVLRLQEGGVKSPALDSRLLLGMALGLDRAVLPHETLDGFDDAAAAIFEALLTRRLSGEPVSRIRGWREFWTLRLELVPATLDPRPDSETIVAAALAATDPSKPCRMLDLGCGTGALLLACLSECPNATGTGVDIAGEAVEVATRNAEKNGLSARADFVIGDFADLDVAPGCYDLVLCNPPYIPAGEIDGLAVEVVRFEPRLALDGGDDGLDCWRAVLPRIAAELSGGGRACLEIGAGQAEAVLGLAAKAGLCEISREKDLADICRCLVLGLCDNPATGTLG